MPATTNRRRRPTTEERLAALTTGVDQLIAENRSLKRRLASLEGGTDGAAGRRLAGLQRSLQRALEGPPSARPTSRQRRPRKAITDPEVLERRRAALAKARAARAAKRGAAQPTG